MYFFIIAKIEKRENRQDKIKDEKLHKKRKGYLSRLFRNGILVLKKEG